MNKKPNILFFFTDDQRFDTIHALGNPDVITPNMDKLVKNGVAFTNAHIPSGTSAAVCMPSRAMLHTGRTLFHLQNEGQEIPAEHITMGEAFQRGGYRTYGSGKWHNGTKAYARSFSDGSEIFFGGMWDHWNVPMCNFDPDGKYENVINFTPNFGLSRNTTKVNCDKFTTGKHSTEAISDAAINFLNKNDNSEQPFFMYLSFLAPHDPRTMPQKFRDMYDVDNISFPDNFLEEHSFDYGVKDIRDELLTSYPRTANEVKKHIAEYYGMITHLDYEIGRVLEALEKTGQMDNTIIVLAGDNGLAVGQHGLMGKQSHYEHSIRVPLLFSGPKIPKNIRKDQYVYLLDIYPTLCELTGVEIPNTVDGKSMVPVIYGEETTHRETLYFAYNDIIRSVKDQRYKLIEYVGNHRMTQLFDLQKDPLEMKNLYNSEASGELKSVIEKLRGELERYRIEWEDEKHRFGKSFWNKYNVLYSKL